MPKTSHHAPRNLKFGPKAITTLAKGLETTFFSLTKVSPWYLSDRIKKMWRTYY